MDGRNLLIFYAIISKGDYFKINEAIRDKPEYDDRLILSVLERVKCKVVTMLDAEYPQELYKITPAPFVLFYYGDLSLLNNLERNISVVGSRENTPYGEMMTKKIVEKLAPSYNIVSGLAIGIDTVALQTAIDNGGHVIAIIPSGIEECYPKRNIDLYKEIKRNHLLISEYPFDTPAEPNSCRMRNRIVSALSNSLLVTEAHGNSGTLITIGYTLMQGKEVFCVPYRADEKSHCNRLIKEGALLVEDAEEIIYQLEKNGKKI